MSATDELRAELTKRGVEWKAPASFDGTARYDTTAGGYWFHEFDGKITIHGLTPAQAIAATLGRGTLTAEQASRATYAHSIHADCADADWQAIADELNVTLGSEDTYTREDVEGAFVSGYSLGLDMFDSSKTEKGWNQNERNLDEEMEDLGWVRKDAATPDAGTCQLKRASWDDGACTWGCICSACDAHLEHETGIGYNYCPICGAKVVEE